MPNQPYFPVKEADQVLWLNNYMNKITFHGPIVGITAPEIADTLMDLAHAKAIIENWHPTIQQDAREATAYKRLILDAPANTTGTVPYPVATVFAGLPLERAPGGLKRMFNQVQRIKNHASYTTVMGEDLKIIGEENSAVHLTPEFTATVADGPSGQVVRIRFKKFDHDGVYIQCRRNGGAWALLGIDLVTPYIDNQVLLVAVTPETREYRMSFWDGGDPNGDWTDVAKVTVGA